MNSRKCQLKYTTSVVDVNLQLRVLSAEESSKICKESIQHLLLHSYQIHQPYVFLEKEFNCGSEEESASSKLRLGRRSKRRKETVAAIKKNFLGLDEVFQHAEVKSIALLLGKTIISPKKVYVLDLSSLIVGHNYQMVDSTQLGCERKKQIAKTCRKLIRTLMMDSVLQEMDRLPVCNTYILVSVARTDDNMMLSSEYSYLPKMEYQLPTRGDTIKIVLNSHDDSKTTEKGVKPGIGSKETMWFQAPFTIKGYKEETNGGPM